MWRTLVHRRRAAGDLLRREGPRALARRGLLFCLRQYAHRGGWPGQYRRRPDLLAPGRQEIGDAERRLAAGGAAPLLSLVVVPGGGADELERTVISVAEGSYPRWELLTVGAATASRERGEGGDERLRRLAQGADPLAEARGEWVGLVEAGDTVHRDALLLVAAACASPETDLVYTDEDVRDREGRPRAVRLKPGWSPEMLLAYPYTGRLCVMRRDLVARDLVATEGPELLWEEGREHDLALRAGERARRVERIPRVLYHRAWRGGAGAGSLPGARAAVERALRRRGVAGRVEPGLLPGTLRVRPELAKVGEVDILIATHNQGARLARCLASIEKHSAGVRHRVLVVDHASDEAGTRRLLSQLPHPVLRVEGPFNFSRLMNRAAAEATGDYLLFLNDDTEVGPGWLEAMLEAAELPGVGVVGAKLLYPSGEVQHAGVVLGIGQVAGHSHKFWPGTSAGCLGSLAVLRNYSAVDGACLLVRRRLFEEAGGFDEELGGHFQDVDFCLRLARRGYRTVFTPFAVVTHVEEASGQRPVRPEEAAHMEARWGYELADDPYYHPLLTRRQEGFDIDVWRGRPAGWLRRSLGGLS